MGREMGISSDKKACAYTTTRSDVIDLVPRSAHQILDVGCSNGAVGLALMEMVPGRSVGGIEYDAGFAEEAANCLDFVVNADLNHLDWGKALGDRRFDCIIFADVLEHLVDPEYSLSQAVQHLLSRGSIVVSLPNIRHISALYAIFWGGRFPRRDRGIFDRTHLHWFTLRDARDLMVDNSLHISSERQSLRWGDVGGGRVNRFLNHLPQSLKAWGPVRELLTYQICMRGEIA